MLQFPLGSMRRILCLGAHSDDIEIGAGGTLLKLIGDVPDLEVWWVVFSAPGPRAEEASRSADDFLDSVAHKQVKIGSFRESYFPSEWTSIKEWFEEIRAKFDPDVIFTHFRQDLHQDHRMVCELTWNTFRNHFILEYEIPKYDADLRSPNFFVPLSDAQARKKVNGLMRYFGTQRNKQWFSEDLFYGLMRLRSIEVASPTKHAEAFHCRKVLLGQAN